MGNGKFAQLGQFAGLRNIRLHETGCDGTKGRWSAFGLTTELLTSLPPWDGGALVKGPLRFPERPVPLVGLACCEGRSGSWSCVRILGRPDSPVVRYGDRNG